VVDPVRAQPDLFPELAQLQRDAADLAGKLKAAEAAAAEASGRDPSEQVRVVLDPASRIEQVEIEPGWRSHMEASDIGQAVVLAYREAGSRRLAAWAAEISRAEGDPGAHDVDPTQPDAAAGSSRPGITSGPFDAAAHDSMRRLWYLLQDATDQLDEVAREAVDRSAAVVTGRDSAGHVAATFVGGDLTDLSADEQWSAGAGGREIGSAVTEAIRHGYAAVDKLAKGSVTSGWPFTDLDRLSGDPATLLASLGFPVPGPARDETEGV
jgi:hypothetical protein